MNVLSHYTGMQIVKQSQRTMTLQRVTLMKGTSSEPPMTESATLLME